MSGYKDLKDKEKELYSNEEKKLYKYVETFNIKEFNEAVEEDKSIKTHIFTAIVKLCNYKKDHTHPNFVIDYLKSHENLEIIEFVDNVEMKLDDLQIKAKPLSGNIKGLSDNTYDRQYLNNSNATNIINLISKFKNPAKLVTGYVYGVNEKLKKLTTWIELNDDGVEYVVDFDNNIIINKEAFYYLTCAEVLNIVDKKTFDKDKKTLSELENIEDIKEIYLAFRDELMKDVTFNEDNKKTY